MAQLMTVRLSREGGCPWGFRLQGGKDFGTPLVIQKVNGASPAERAGLIAGDSVIRVNTTDVFNLRHKDAQDVIVRAGQSFEMTVQRGGSTWKPAVTPVGTLSRPQPVSNNIAPVTKTSLAAQNQAYTPIGAAHNVSPKGFPAAPHMNGDGPKLVNKQYNSPMALYSEQSIAETLSAQAEVLSTGALGVNFKKNEKNYDSEKSEVFKMLQEAEREPRTPEPARHDVYSTMSHAIGGRATSPRPMTPVPPKPQVRHDIGARTSNVTNEQGNPTCSECERLIVGVFVRIKDKNLHVECFKCATCGSSLKNVGYYNINNKLYCDIHAKLAARSNPPAPNMVPVTVPPGGRIPAGTIAAALSSHSMPSPAPMSPSSNQMAAPFSPHSKQESIERFSPNNVHPQKVDAVANLISALTMATQKEYKENGTNTDPMFLTEKVIPISNSFNNNDNNGHGIKEEHFPSPAVKYMPYRPKSGGSFSGPRPFSSVQPSTPTYAPAPFSSVQPSTPIAAPISAPLSNTLPRSASAANMPERKEWPPSKPDELPTASPLYIDPSSRNSTPLPKISSNPHPQPSQIAVAQNPTPQNTVPQNPYIPVNQHSEAQNHHYPVPQITISQNPPPTIAINETKMSNSQVEALSSEYKSTQQSSNISQNFERNMSICSAEVTNITGRRSVMECVETVSDALDTQMLVNNVTKIKERPKSPPLLHRKDSVYDTQDISIVVSTRAPSDKNPTSEKPVITVDDKSKVNIEQITHSKCNPGNPQVCSNNPRSNPCPMSNPDCAVNIVTCPQNNPTCSMNAQSTSNIQSTQNVQSSTNVQRTQNVQSTRNVQGTSKSSEAISSSKTITNPVPKEYITPMVKALTIASDRPFNTVCVEIKSKEYGTGQTSREVYQTQTTSTSATSMQAKQQVKASQEIKASQNVRTLQESKTMQDTRAMQEIKSKTEAKFPHVKAPVAASPLTSALTVAPSKPFTPIPQISMEPVPLPPESTPYFPPEIPITVEPKVQKQQPTSKSPFVQALTTAPDRPYTPLAGLGQEQSDTPDFMKDVPPPSRQKVSMLSALTTASERPFTPALSVESLEDIRPCPIEPLKPQPKKVPPPPPMPVTIKPASHISPSAFRPIGNSSFKPVAQTYKPQASEIPQIVTSFPPVTHELKSNYPSQGFGYSTPSKVATMYDTRTQSNISQQQIHQQQQMNQQQHQMHHQQQQMQQQQQQIHQMTSQQQQMRQMNTQQQQQMHQMTSQQQQMHQQQQQMHYHQQQMHQQQQQIHQMTTQQQQMRQMTSQQIHQQQNNQHANQVRQEEIQQARRQSLKSVSAGLHSPSSIPGYQINLNQKVSDQEQIFVPQIQAPVQPIQKPVTTLQPGQYQPNNHLQTFQPVMDDNNSHYMRSSSPMGRSISPSMINKPAPSIPYYQADLVAHECQPVESNLLDPRSPGISRSPSPCPGARSTSPFPRHERTMTKSPAQGPPPNPLADRVPKQPTIRNEKYLEAKQNLTTYIPKYQGRVEQVKSQLTVDQGAQSRQFSGQTQMMSGQSQVATGHSQYLGRQSQIATQSQNYQNVQLSHSEKQQQNQMYKMSEVENVRHMEQLNKSQMKSVETSADNRMQIQRTKRCTEEYERTQKEKTIEIQRTGGHTQINRNVSSVPGASSIGFQRQTSLTHTQPSVSRAPQKPFAPVGNSRSYSLPGVAAAAPKQFKPSPLAATTPKVPVGVGSQSASRPNVPQPYAGAATGRQAGAIGVAPRRGRGILNLSSGPGNRVPLCGQCNMHIRGPFITALGKIWCPEHFTCTTPSCRRPLQDMGFVEEKGQLYCEYCFEQYLAPNCGKCSSKIKGDCLNAIGKQFHPECFTCAYCSKLFGNSPFFLEDGLPYCEADWNELFTTKCFACGFPVEAGDRWVEALSNNYHSQCFNCTMCKKNLEGQSFYAKGGRPFCKNHAR